MPRLKGFRFRVRSSLMLSGFTIALHSALRMLNICSRNRPRTTDKWHLDEVITPIDGRKCWLWQAADANGDTLDILIQSRRSAKAARRFLKRLISQFGEPRVVITDKLRSYFKPIRDLAPDAEHRAHKGLKNRIKGSHWPTRKREKLIGRFKSLRQTQRFFSAQDQINTISRPRCDQLATVSYRHARTDAFGLWDGRALEMIAG